MDKLEKDIFEGLAKQIIEKLKVNEKLGNMVCDQHHQRPEVIVTGTINQPELLIEGCCKEIEKEARQTLGL